MKKIKVLSIVVIVLAFFVSCQESREVEGLEEQIMIEEFDKEVEISHAQIKAEIEAVNYEADSILFLSTAERTAFDIDNSDEYFVQYWNTPDYTLHGFWTGISWNGNSFIGTVQGDYVFYLYSYRVQSDRWKAETGDSILMVERKFPKSGVITDPRQTAWWLSSLETLDGNLSLEDALRELTWIHKDKGFDENLSKYLNVLRKEVFAISGKTVQEKLINYTKLVISGDPKDWGAESNPGYYNDGNDY